MSPGATTFRRHLHLGVAVDGAGFHPGAWRQPDVAGSLLDPHRLTALARTADAAGWMFLALDDDFAREGFELLPGE